MTTDQACLENLLVAQALKGSDLSGNWGHTSEQRRGVGRGGSDPGGGLAAIGAGPMWPAKARRWRSAEIRRKRQAQAEAAARSVSSGFNQAIAKGRVTSSSKLQGGITEGSIINIEGPDGKTYTAIQKPMRADAGFHDGNSEVAAYRVAKLMGIDRVPETEFVKPGGGIGKEVSGFADAGGTVQQFIHGAHTFTYKDQIDETARLEIIALDIVTYNPDRHDLNWIHDPSGKIWAIDNGHASWEQFRTSNHSPMWRSAMVGRGTAGKRKGSVKFTPDQIQRWSKITRTEWDAAFEGISQGGNVDAAMGWDNLQYIIEQGGLIRW